MSGGSHVNSAGLRDPHLHIDGVELGLPWTLLVSNPAQQTISPTGGRRRIDKPYKGPGLPDSIDLFEWSLRWDLNNDFADEIDFLESLKAGGGVHEFVYWKKYRYQYTVAAGQTVFYLLRPDAYSEDYVGKTGSDYKAVIKANGTPVATVNYVSSVTSGTSVSAGQVSISKTSVEHPEMGSTVALFKFGSGLIGAGSIVTVDYHPHFRVAVGSLETDPFEKAGHENKALYVVEVD